MADELASLVVSVDSSTAKSAVNDLEKLSVAGDKADTSAKKLSGTWSGMSMSSTQLYSANRALSEFRKSAVDASKGVQAVDDSWKKATFNPTQLYGANRALNQFKAELQAAATPSTMQASANKVLAESHHQVAKAAAGYTKSAKEMAFATRNLPAQFTDIAVSLQAGQNPLTVFLQQGGQLKDMFGGVGPAAKALGGYILGLVNPYTVAAAAVVALGTAYVAGEKENVAYAKSLAMVGSSVGATISDLERASESMERFGQTQGKSAEALAIAAAAGDFFGGQMEMVAQAAINMERETGVAMEKTVEQFSKLAKDPLDASVKLNESFHYLTTTTYEQIAALQDQGNTLGAAQVAMEAYAGAVNERTAEVERSLGTLEQGWRAVANTAKAAWDAMKDVGRPGSLSEQMAELGTKLQEVENPSNMFSFAHLGAKGSDARQKYAAQIREEIMGLQDQYVAEQKAATRKLDERMASESAQALDQEVRRYATNAQKRVLERTRINETARRAIEAEERLGGAGSVERIAKIKADQASALEAAERRLKDPAARKPKLTEEDKFLRAQAAEYERLTKSIDQHIGVLHEAEQSEEHLSDTQRFAARIITALDEGHTKLTKTQQEAIKVQLEEALAIDESNRARDKQNKLLEINQRMNDRTKIEMQRRATDADRDIRNIGMGGSRAEQAGAMDQIRDRAAEDRIELARRYGELNAENTDEYIRQLDEIDAAERAQLEREEEYFRRRQEAQGDWRNGARRAMDEIADQVNDVAGQTRDGFINAFNAMNAAIDHFAQTGKFKFKDLAKTILAELLKIELRILLSKVLTGIFGGGMGGEGTASTGSSGGVGTGPAALGAVYGAGGQMAAYARGSAFGAPLGGVGNSATLFPMANGGRALAFESGPEAIMPLTRGPNGKLGVEAVGGGGGGTVFNVSTNVNIMGDGTSTSSARANGNDEDSAMGRKLASVLDKKIRDVLNQERQQGGILWQMAQGR